MARSLLVLAMYHLPARRALFGTSPISPGQCAAWMALGSLPLLVLELRRVLPHSRAVRQAV
jgi:Ca2+-transporting ATPase